MRGIVGSGALALLLALSGGAAGQTPITLVVAGNQAEGTFSFPGGIDGDLTVTFESASDLTATSLEAWASVVNPSDPSLLARLPPLTSIPAAFPVLVQVGPSAGSTLSFTGVAKVSLHTHNLSYDPDGSCSLLKAHNGASFGDVTVTEGSGSYRVTGSGGDFSEFLIVDDARPIDAVIVGKFDSLQATLNEHSGSMPVLVAATLQARLSLARTLYELGSLLSAISKLTSFASYVITHSGADIPNVWDAADASLIDVAGLLRAGAETLKFSLDRKASH